MRVFEILQQHTSGYNRLLDVSGRPDVQPHLRPPLSEVSLEVSEGAIADVRAGDILVAASGEVLDAEQVEALARAVPGGAALLLLLSTPLHEIPVGALVSALTSAGMQVVQAAPVSHPVYTAAVIARPAATTVPFVEYLAFGTDVVPGDAALRRLISEHLVEGLVGRARQQRYEQDMAKAAERDERLAAAQADAAAARAEAARQAARYDALAASRQVAVGRALGTARRHPVSGARQLARAVRSGAHADAESAAQAAAQDPPPAPAPVTLDVPGG